MEHASTVDIGARKRRGGGINEDSVATAVFENHHRETGRSVGIFVLGDGVGGEASGDIASFLATTIVRKRLTKLLQGPATDILHRFDIGAYGETPPTMQDVSDPRGALDEERIRTAIHDGINMAHQHIQEYAREIGARPATTVVAGVYIDGELHYGWAGDSRCYVVNTEHEEMTQLTRDHAVTNKLLENGEIEHEEYARVHEDATAITNAVGGSGHGKPAVDVEFGSAEIYEDDLIMLTSDGLIDAYPDVRPLREQYQEADDREAVCEEIRETVVTEEEIREIILDAPDLDAAVEELVDFANDRGGKDNLSITLARDSAADPTPDSLPTRGAETRWRDAEDAVASDSGNKSGDTGDETDGSGRSKSDESAAADSDGDPSSAAIAVPGEETLFEISGDVTVGRASDGEKPDIPLDVDEEAIVEQTHTVVTFDDGSDEWRVTDTSSSGTYVEVDDGEWLLLLSSEGAELHREHGFDPGAAAERDLSETTALEDGMAFTLEDPRNDEAVVCQFFTSVERARTLMKRGEVADSTQFSRFLM